MNRRNFLKQFGALAASGLILPEAAKASGFQVIIPAQGVVPASPAKPAGVSAQYWRLVTRDTALFAGPVHRYVIAEIRMMDASGKNIATMGGTIASVGAYGGGVSYEAFDGLVGIGAGAYAELPFIDGAWIGQNFGKLVTIEEIKITSNSNNYLMPNFDVQISSDGANWLTSGTMLSLNQGGSTWFSYKPS